MLVLGGSTDCHLSLWIENHQVGVATRSNSSLTRIEAKELSWSRRYQVDKMLESQFACAHTLVEQNYTMLHSWQAVGNFCEIVQSQFFLTRKMKRGMIGGNDLKLTALRPSQRASLSAMLRIGGVQTNFALSKPGDA